MRLIVVDHDGILYYYQPMEQCWYPEPNIHDCHMFTVPEQSLKQHLKKAREMWDSPDTNINDIDTIAA